MSDKKKKPSAWGSKGGYEPEWAQELDAEARPGQRSDSERFEHALDMGVTAAETLKRDEALGLVPSSKRSHPLAMLLFVVLLMCGGILASIATSHNNEAEPVSQSEQGEGTQEKQDTHDVQDKDEQEKLNPPAIFPEKLDDEMYSVHVSLPSSSKSVTQKIVVPDKVNGVSLWVMRVQSTVNKSPKYVPECDIKVRRVSANGWRASAPYDDACLDLQESAPPALFPLYPNTIYRPQKGKLTVEVSGTEAEVDIEFLPASQATDTWDRSQPFKGKGSSVVSFSGSLADVELRYGYSDIKLFAHKAGTSDFIEITDWLSFDVTARGSSMRKAVIDREKIEKYGFASDSVKGYLFIEVDPGNPQLAWWQLN